MTLADVEQSFNGLMDLMVKEQYLESCPMQLAIFRRERKPKVLNVLAALADQYLDAHANSKKSEAKFHACNNLLCKITYR